MGGACSKSDGVHTPLNSPASQQQTPTSDQKYVQNNDGPSTSAPPVANPPLSSGAPADAKSNDQKNPQTGDADGTEGGGGAAPAADLDPVAAANQANYVMIKSTWALCIKKPDFAIAVYNKLLVKYQAATEALFYGVDIALQSQRLIDMIGAGVKLLDKPDSLIPIMLQLGARHVIYGVSDAHFDMFNDALMMAMQDGLGYWNAELTTQWVRVLTLFKTMILHGYTTPAGLQMRKKYNLRILRALLKCWRTILDNDTNDEESFVSILHRFGRQKVGGRAEMFNGIVARRVPFMAMMTLAFEKGVEDAEVIQQAHDLGARHIAYGLEERDYDAYAGPFIAAIQQKASPETFNPFIKAQLSLFWVSLTKLMVQGAAESTCGYTLRFAPKTAGFALVMANIEKSTQLWEGQQTAMTAAVQSHYRLLRELITAHDGYEAGIDKDSFTIALKDITSAFALALRLQVLLLRNPVEGFVMDADTEGEGPREVWNNHSLRVRIGIHWCKDATVHFNVPERKYEYSGPDVDICRVVADNACGGQTLVTEPTLKHFLNVGRFNEMTEAMGDIRKIDGNPNPAGPSAKPTAEGAPPSPDAAKLSEVFNNTPYQNNFTIPVTPAVAALGYSAGMASSHHPSVTTLVSVYPTCLAARTFKGRKRIAPPPQ